MTTEETKTALQARAEAQAAAKAARENLAKAKKERAAEVAAIKQAAAISKTLAAAASVSLGTAKRALKEGTAGMRGGLTKGRLENAAKVLGITLGSPTP